MRCRNFKIKIKRKLLKGTDGNLAESLIDIILEQGSTIKDMEMKCYMITETVNQQGGQILAIQERITDLENIIQKQNQDIANLEYEKYLLNDTVINQRVEMGIMGKEMVKIMKGFKNIMNDSETQKGKANGNVLWSTSTIQNDVLPAGIRENSHNENNAAGKETGDSVIAYNKVEYNVSNNKYRNGFHAQDGPKSGILGNEHDRLQRRSVICVAFSAYQTKHLTHWTCY